ncbi:bifunctional [glutamate--ammonia ligase]-adenylyl-L-tyrosine phosphorylase/[glutamate--ammonia-ligase] adenylyltransferase [Thermosulfuriphilus sp.]
MERLAQLARRLSPDPEAAMRGWERLVSAHPDLPWNDLLGQEKVLSSLLRLLGASNYLTNALVNDKKALQEIFFEGHLFLPSLVSLRRELYPLPEDRSAFVRLLRKVKKRAFVRVAALDLGGLAFVRIVRSVTAIYQGLLEAALDFAARLVDLSSKDLVVLGMGKLGARELNYSSDVDLIFLASGTKSRAKVIRLAETFIQLLSAYIEGDMAARVDMRLRPGGKDGELVHSLSAALTYYRFQARAWEHLALIKARPVAGDMEAGLHFLRAIEPTVFRRFLDYTYLEEIAHLKEKIIRETAQKKLLRDIKLGPGGIREIEFFVQALQLIFGGRLPQIRSRDTLRGLKRLFRTGLIPQEALTDLSEAYIFLRTLEHRLQMTHFNQTHRLPDQPLALRNLARSIGLADEDQLKEALAEIRRRVEGHFRALFRPTGKTTSSQRLREFLDSALAGEPLEEAAAELGLSSTEPLASLVAKFKGQSLLSQRRREILWPVLAELIQMAIKTPQPERALANLDTFITRAGGRTSLLYLLKDRPDVAERLIYVLGTSPFLSDLLLKGPILSEALVLRIDHPGEIKKEELFYQLQREDYGEAVASLRRFKNEEILATGFAELNGRIQAVAQRLATIAEVVLKGAYFLSQREIKRRIGRLPQSMAIMALGKLGGRELSYRSDLDIIFLYEGGQEEMIVSTKLAQNLISVLTMPLEEGPGYEVDVRLRPGGNKGPLVSEIEAFLEYHQRDSDLWEKQALLRLAYLEGNQELGQRALEAVGRILTNLKIGRKEGKRLREMRERIEKERSREEKGRFNPKVGYGALADIEFIVQWLGLRFAPRLGGLFPPNTLEALNVLAREKILAPETACTLGHNYRFLRRLDRRLVLFYDRRTEERVYSAEEIRQAEVILGPGSLEEYLKVREINRRLFNEILPS